MASALPQLSADILFLISHHLSPVEVLDLCSTARAFHNTLHGSSFWEAYHRAKNLSWSRAYFTRGGLELWPFFEHHGLLDPDGASATSAEWRTSCVRRFVYLSALSDLPSSCQYAKHHFEKSLIVRFFSLEEPQLGTMYKRYQTLPVVRDRSFKITGTPPVFTGWKLDWEKYDKKDFSSKLLCCFLELTLPQLLNSKQHQGVEEQKTQKSRKPQKPGQQSPELHMPMTCFDPHHASYAFHPHLLARDFAEFVSLGHNVFTGDNVEWALADRACGLYGNYNCEVVIWGQELLTLLQEVYPASAFENQVLVPCKEFKCFRDLVQ